MPVAVTVLIMMIPYALYAVVDRNGEVEKRALERVEVVMRAVEAAWELESEGSSAAPGDGAGPSAVEIAESLGSFAGCEVVLLPDGEPASLEDTWAASLPVIEAVSVVDVSDGATAYALARYVRSALIPGGGGKLAVAVPLSDYRGIAVGYIITDIAFLLVLVASILIALWIPVTKYVTHPIEKLDLATAHIAQGNLSLRVDRRKIDARGELGSLADSFNLMIESVAASQNEIERRVVERTAELIEANAQLEARARQIERLNGELAEQNRYKSEFLAIVSHELKTPITALSTNLDNVREEEDKEARKAICDQMEYSLDGLQRQILMILDAARVESGVITPQVRAVDINDVIVEVESMLSTIARGKNVSCAVSLDEIPVLMTDPDMIYKIGSNLVGNAIKFTPPGGWVRVRVAFNAEDSRLFIEVQDSGIGLDDIDPSCLFERFRQGNSSVGRFFGGTGLGLSLSRDFARMLGGDIEAHGLDKGSRFVAWVRAEPWKEGDSDG